MKKLETRYALTNDVQLIVNNESTGVVSVVQYGEACSGILKHWGTPKQLTKELRQIADLIEKNFNNK